MKFNIIYTLEVQDGENRYTLHSPQTVEIDVKKDLQPQINEFGEELAKDYISNPTSDEQINDWYEIDNGCRLIRYKGFEIINNLDVFKQIEHILYK
jgi:hypothetical protein